MHATGASAAAAAERAHAGWGAGGTALQAPPLEAPYQHARPMGEGKWGGGGAAAHLLSRSGRPNSIFLSRRPGRSRAGSNVSGRLVAMSTCAGRA